MLLYYVSKICHDNNIKIIEKENLKYNVKIDDNNEKENECLLIKSNESSVAVQNKSCCSQLMFDLDADVDGVLDLPEGRQDLLVEVVVDEAVQGGVGDGAGHPQEVAGHVGHHQGLCS